jgi:hypothetical protein
MKMPLLAIALGATIMPALAAADYRTWTSAGLLQLWATLNSNAGAGQATTPRRCGPAMSATS